MKYCTKCGKELLDEAVMCPGCGCPIEGAQIQSTPAKKAASYDEAVKGAVTTNIISAVVLAAGVVCALLVNVWIGIIACLAAELVAVIPNTKLQKAIKQNNSTITDKKQMKATAKAIQKDVKSKSGAYKGSFIIAYIALACVIVFALLA